MNEEQKISVLKALLEFAAAFVWPILIIVVVIIFRKEIGKLVERIKTISFPGGGVTIQDEDPEAIGGSREAVIEMQDAEGFYTIAGLSKLIFESGLAGSDEPVAGQLLLYQTASQHTWLLATKHQLLCILDDSKTRAKGRLIQWRMPLSSADPIRARISLKGSHVVDVGHKSRWLYSLDLHPDENMLVRQIKELVGQ